MIKETKVCNKCGIEKPLSEYRLTYYKNRGKSYYSGACKECQKVDRKIYNEKNRKEILEKGRKRAIIYRKTHSEEIKERSKKYRIKNKEKITKRQNEWCKRKSRTDSVYNLKVRIRQSIKRSLNKKGFERSRSCEKILGCDYETFVNHLLNTYKENYGEEYNNNIKVHIDHIVPLKIAKTKNDIIRLNHYTNLQLLKAEDNLHKGAKLDWRLDDVKREHTGKISKHFN